MKSSFQYVREQDCRKERDGWDVGDYSELLFQEDGSSLYRMGYTKGTTGAMVPPECGEAVEQYYVLSGKIEFSNYNGTLAVLETGDLLTMRFPNQEPLVLMGVLEDAECLLRTTATERVIDNGKMYLITEMMKRLEEKDGYTYSHCRRVNDLVMRMAGVMNYPMSGVRSLMRAASFHDVGKCKIPEKYC